VPLGGGEPENLKKMVERLSSRRQSLAGKDPLNWKDDDVKGPSRGFSSRGEDSIKRRPCKDGPFGLRCSSLLGIKP